MEENVLDTNLMDGLAITPEITSYLSEAAKWGKFLGIMGFIFSGFIMLIGIFAGTLLSSFASMSDEIGGLGAIGGGFIGGLYIFMGLLYFVPSYFLYKHSQKMKLALKQNSQELMTESFKNYKSLYKFWGIFTAIILGLYALIFVFAIIGGVASAF